MDFQDKELQDWTVGDWIAARAEMTGSAFRQRVQAARAGGIAVPGVVGGRMPRIVFEAKDGSDFALAERVKDTEALNRFNTGVKAWAEKVAGELRASAQSSFGHRDAQLVTALQPRLADSIRVNIRFDKKYMLETRSVGFSIARHGVYLHYGAGRGQGGMKGSRWTDRYGRLKKTNPDSMGKAGGAPRSAEHWFNSVIERNAKELAELVAEYSLDLTMDIAGALLP